MEEYDPGGSWGSESLCAYQNKDGVVVTPAAQQIFDNRIECTNAAVAERHTRHVEVVVGLSPMEVRLLSAAPNPMFYEWGFPDPHSFGPVV